MDKIMKLSKKYGLFVIEDAAQMLGQTYKGKPCGSFGDISTFSFYPNKQITTGEGGMCVVNNKELAERCKSLRNLCFNNEKRFIHDELGWNYRMTNMQAAIGVAQIEKLQVHVRRKREIAKLYKKLIRFNNCINMSVDSTSYSENIYWVIGILICDNCKYSAKDAMNYLSEYGVGVRPFFYPLDMQPAFDMTTFVKKGHNPNSRKLYEKGFYIPSGLGITNNQIIQVSNRVNKMIVDFTN